MATVDYRSFTLYVEYPNYNDEVPIGFVVKSTHSIITSAFGSCFVIDAPKSNIEGVGRANMSSNVAYILVDTVTSTYAQLDLYVRTSYSNSSNFVNSMQLCPLYASIFNT